MATQRRVTTGLMLGSMVLVLLGCNSSPTDPGSSGGVQVSFQTILAATLPGQRPNLEGREAVRDRATWQAVWTELHQVGSPAPLPTVDFGREMVVVVVGPGCCGAVEIVSIAQGQGELVVNAEAAANTNALCVLADFSVHAVRIPRVAASVRVVVRQSEKLC